MDNDNRQSLIHYFHYKRHDIEAKVLLFLVQTLYWFNPFVHLLAKKFNEAIKMSGDEYVISGNDEIYKKDTWKRFCNP